MSFSCTAPGTARALRPIMPRNSISATRSLRIAIRNSIDFFFVLSFEGLWLFIARFICYVNRLRVVFVKLSVVVSRNFRKRPSHPTEGGNCKWHKSGLRDIKALSLLRHFIRASKACDQMKWDENQNDVNAKSQLLIFYEGRFSEPHVSAHSIHISEDLSNLLIFYSTREIL